MDTGLVHAMIQLLHYPDGGDTDGDALPQGESAQEHFQWVLREIVEIDFFGAPARADAKKAITGVMLFEGLYESFRRKNR